MAADVGDNPIGVGDTLGGQTIGQEDDDLGTLAVGHGQSLRQGQVYVRPPYGTQIIDEPARLIACRSGFGFPRVSPDTRAESHDVEPVLRVQMVEDELQSIFGLIYLLPLHASGSVQHEDHILGHHIPFVHLDLRRHQQQEEAILSALPVAEHTHAEILIGDGVVEFKIPVWKHV